MKKKCLVIMTNAEFSAEGVKEKISELPGNENHCKDINLVRSYGAKKYANLLVYTTEKNKDAVEKLYKESNPLVKIIKIEEVKSLVDYTSEDFEALKKGELDKLCKENEILFGEISYSTSNKADLVKAMAKAVQG